MEILMIISISKENLMELCVKQLTNLLIFNYNDEKEVLFESINNALQRSEINFSHTTNKYYSKNGEVFFDPFHSGQYSIFLYYLSNTLWKKFNNNSLATRVYYLNKILNSVELYYEVNLPDIFSLDHPLGTVMGRAQYSNYIQFSQNCTVGNNKGKYPRLGEKIIMFSGVTILGDSCIEGNCVISANSYIKDENIPLNSIVFGQSPNLIIKTKSKVVMQSYFDSIWK